MATNIDFVKKCIENKNIRAGGCEEALFAMRFETFSQGDTEFFKNAYFTIKGDADRTAFRDTLLNALVLRCLQYDLKDFFLTVFKKERHLSTRLTAIRGYSAYASETEVIPLMDKFISLLTKECERASLKNHTHTELESLRSKFGLPYLVDYYGYNCFKKAMEQLNKQYNDLPDDLKGYFTLDENGMFVQLLSDEEVKRKLDVFLNKLEKNDVN